MDFDALADGRQTINATPSPCTSDDVQMSGTGWNAARRKLVAELWINHSISASQIAARLGGGLTRNAVLGYANRQIKHGYLKPRGQGQPRRNKLPKDEPWLQLGISKTTFRRWRANGGPPQRQQPRRRALSEAVLEQPDRQPIAFHQLSNRTCRWPIGDALPYLYCGAAPAEHFTYCSYHCLQAYRNVRVVR